MDGKLVLYPRVPIHMWVGGTISFPDVALEQIREEIKALQEEEIFIYAGVEWYNGQEFFKIFSIPNHPDRVIVTCYSLQLGEVKVNQLIDPAVLSNSEVLSSTIWGHYKMNQTVSKQMAIEAVEYFYHGDKFPDTFMWRVS